MSDDLNPHTKNVLTDSQKLDTELEFDPVLEEGRASALRVSVYVIAGLATAATRWMWKRSYVELLRRRQTIRERSFSAIRDD